MKKRKTQEEFEQELFSVLPDIKVLGQYINMNTKIRFKCLIHDFEFDAFPQNMLRGNGCRKCGNEKQSVKQTKSHKQFVEQLKSVNPNIEVIGKYINMDTNIDVMCLIDGYTWRADPRKLLRGSGCAVCSNRKVLAGINDIATARPDLVKYFKDPSDATRYTPGSEAYVNVVCPECGHTDIVKVGNLSRFGLACNGCYELKHGRLRAARGYWNIETMKAYMLDNYPGYTLIDVQTPHGNDGYLKALIKCPNEKHDAYWTYWTNVIAGHKCLLCSIESSMSHGEQMAEEMFKKHNINFISQKRFDDCKDKHTLPFDFYLPDYNLVVEIMGEQHERPIDHFGGLEAFDTRIKHDTMKRNYLLLNNINILDIWYYEFNGMEDLILNKIQEIANNTKLT